MRRLPAPSLRPVSPAPWLRGGWIVPNRPVGTGAGAGALFTFIIAAAPRRRMSSKGWWIGMAVAAAVVYYGTYSFLPFK